MGKSRLASCGDTAPFSWVLVHTGFCLCIQGSVSLVLCKFSWLYGGVNGDHLQEGLSYAIHRSDAPRGPAPTAVHCWPIPPQETLKHSKAGLAQSLWSLLVCTRSCLSPSSVSGGYGVWFWTWFHPSYHLAGASPLPLDMGYIFFGGIQHSPVDGRSVVSSNFGVLSGEDVHMYFYSTILNVPASVRSIPFPSFIVPIFAQCLKCSLDISNFPEAISSLSFSIVFLYFFALITEEGFLISHCYSLVLCIQMGISFLFSFAFSFSFLSYF